MSSFYKMEEVQRMCKLFTGNDLERKARELGVDIKGDLIFQTTIGREPRAPDYELQRRVTEAERAIRDSRMWIYALISAIASLASAVAAIIAVVKR
jgi:hypothetical protein